MAITIDSAAASLNRHAVVYGADLQKKLRQGLEFEQIAAARAADNTYSAPNATASEILQAYQWKFTPKGNVSFDAVENKLRKIKLDVQFTGDDLEKFYDSWRVEWHEIGRDPLSWSFPRFIYEEVMVPKLIEELNQIAWAGVYAAPTDGTAASALSAVDGYDKIIKDAITASSVTPIATGTLSPTTMVDKVETFVDGIPQPYRDTPGVILMSATRARQYARDYREQFGTGNGVIGNENNELLVDYSGKRIRGLVGITNDRFIFVPDNMASMIFGTRRGFPTLPAIRWESHERILKGLGEFYRFFGFEFWDHVFVNDQPAP